MDIERLPKKEDREEESNDGTGTSLSVDRISQLPDYLIHRILSFLPAKYAAHASILSKTWNHLCSTSPTLDFDLHYEKPEEEEPIDDVLYIQYINNPTKEEEEFLNLADNSVQRRLQQSVNPCKFRLHLSFNKTKVLAPYMDRWVGTAVERNIQNIELEVSTDCDISYIVPQTLLTAKSLTVLRLSGCTLRSWCDIQLFQLRNLCLTKVHYSVDEMVQNLILNCPLIEALVLEECELDRLRLVPSLIQLKQVHIISCYGLESIEVEAPNLHTFQLRKTSSPTIMFAPNLRTFQLRKTSAPKIMFATIKNLKLHDCDCMTEEQLENLMSEFPSSLEVLELRNCFLLRRIKITSKKLKGLILQSTNFSHVDIDTPNLLSIDLISNSFPMISMNSSHELKKVDIQLWLASSEIQQLAKLKDNLLKSSNSDDFKFVVYYRPLETMMIHEKLSEVQLSPLCKLIGLFNSIFICITSTSCTDLVNKIVCPWRPKTLSVVCPCNKSIDEFLLMKSMDGIGAEDYLWPAWKFFLKSHSTTQYHLTTIWYYGRFQRSCSNRSLSVSSVWDDINKL